VHAQTYRRFRKTGTAPPSQPGTDFTILACAQYAAYLLGSVLSGVIADRFGYAPLFGAATLLPVAVLLGTLRLLAERYRPGSGVRLLR
jgi:PAT family beta-lactamase induction signal transducer AmpG